jgi:hypothetical protein
VTREEQAECLRRGGHEDLARQVESGQLVIPPDDLKETWALFRMADFFSELADSLSRSWWLVTVWEDGSRRTERVCADTEAEAAFCVGRSCWRGARLVSVERDER